MAPTSFLIYSFLLCLALLGAVRAAPLFGCTNYLNVEGTIYRLTNTDTFSQYIQCIYQHDDGNGGIGQNYCWYDFHNKTLYHYPNTPLPLDSHAECPDTLPAATIYRIRSSLNVNLCVTATGVNDGSTDCRTDVWRPDQVWHFNGDLIQPLTTNKCLDVTDGNRNNGAQLQIWTCDAGNPNQLFGHWSEDVVIVPEDHIHWKTSRFQCMDLTGGNTANGTPIQLWGCNYQNPNQVRLHVLFSVIFMLTPLVLALEAGTRGLGALTFST
ncbi:hypothetical protein FA15DRAFT_745064 [Coprinopsis marcescibilis]|uniref:Ricin B lectin domain-containing protein n=1 Tax=Coprinopsis marcescibilis TaxID=230819 RepID=A0A5C3KSK3_COPMA|nr:hypothetical protein FA15DRAFT_745064 [Coprinopsis marcescibilis]